MVKDCEGVPQHLGTQEVDEGIAYVGASEPMLGATKQKPCNYASCESPQETSCIHNNLLD